MTPTLTRLRDYLRRFNHMDERIDQVLLNQGVTLCELHRARPPGPLVDFEFKVFSQWGEDGIIQHLIRNTELKHRTFIEFGVEDFFESNCRFLLMKDHWHGYVIDGSEENMERLRSSYFFWRHPLQTKAGFVNRDNVAALLDESGFDKDLGILSIDVDGVDYHLLERLSEWRARIVIVEYNAVFGSERAVTVPYDASFVRNNAHPSNLYYGASLPAFQNLLAMRGYALVGGNSVGSNAFFVRRDLLNERLNEVHVDACFRESTFRETRDADGNLVYLTSKQGRAAIGHLPLVDTVSGARLSVADL